MARWKEAFGELNYLKAAQEQAPFMSVPHNGGFVALFALRTRVACTRSRTSSVAAATATTVNVLIMKVNLFRGVIN